MLRINLKPVFFCAVKQELNSKLKIEKNKLKLKIIRKHFSQDFKLNPQGKIRHCFCQKFQLVFETYLSFLQTFTDRNKVQKAMRQVVYNIQCNIFI